MRKVSKKSILYHALAAVFTVSMLSNSSVYAFDEQFFSSNDIIYYNPDASGAVCEQGSLSGIAGTGTNKDYRSRPILSDAQLKALSENKPFYEAAADKAGIPWQLLAVIHLRETGLRRYNPVNGDGPYQILSVNYPPSPTIDDVTFAKQSSEAANFLKNAAPSPELLKNGDISAIKDTLFSYNGRASVYAEQATRLGFNQPYEGSPYVMNIADEPRDPERNPTGWGQIKTDGGGIVYPANDDYGAFVVYGAMAGISSTDSCQTAQSGAVRQRVLALAEKELQLWEGDVLKPGTDFHKYSQGRDENWCADFVSWIYSQAGYPLNTSNEGNVPSVDEVAQIGKDGDKFIYHDAAGYTPQPGDLQIQKGSSVSHVSIVVSVDNGVVMKIGGNQSGDGGPSTSSVTKDDWSDSVVGYVSPKE